MLNVVVAHTFLGCSTFQTLELHENFVSTIYEDVTVVKIIKIPNARWSSRDLVSNITSRIFFLILRLMPILRPRYIVFINDTI